MPQQNGQIKPMMNAASVGFGLVLQVDSLEMLIYHLCKGFGSFSIDGFVLKFIVEVVFGLFDIGKPDEEFGFYSSIFFCLMYRI